jgi:hypothetical protein
MFIDLPDVQRFVDELLSQHRYNDAVANVVVGVHNTHRSAEYQQGYLHYPGLDRCIERLSEAALGQASAGGIVEPARGGSLVVATELYAVGGHSRVVADLLSELPQPTLILTDLFGNYRKNIDQLNWVLQQNPRASVVVLLQPTLWDKCVELARLVLRLAPRSIAYLQHHQDALAFIGTQAYAPARKTLLHHCDHNASLGGTLAGVHHVDFTEELAHECAEVLQRPTRVMPLYVADQGAKTFDEPNGRAYSAVTSGTQIKFARTGPVSLQAMAHAVLSTIHGSFVHIGPLDAEWLAEIRQYLTDRAVEPDRFVSMGPVSSLWQTLKSLDAHLYIGSAPVGGGRAAIEAQGCGYPVAFHRSDAQAHTTVRAESVYACKELGWSTLRELQDVLAAYPCSQPALSARARRLYEERYGRGAFVRELAFLTSGA